MKKVLILLLTLALALGGLGFAHAAVTASEEELTVYPTVELGDPTVLDGMTAAVSFTCGDHLQWSTDYTFGGEAKTEFTYHRHRVQPPQALSHSNLDVWFIGGMSASTTGGNISLTSTDYGELLKTVAAVTPSTGRESMNLRMADYVDYYLPDYDLSYRDEERECSESASLYGFITGESWHEEVGSYHALMDRFRFPVQPDHIMSVTVEKDVAGRVSGIELYPENGPELYFISDLNADGAWFVPVFRDEDGTPLPYESPAGHGIYFIPWKTNGTIRYTTGDKDQVTLDVAKAQLRFPLEQDLQIEHMVIDGAAGTAQMLTLENGYYVLTVCDLETGTVRARLEVLPHDPEDPNTAAWFLREEDKLLVVAQNRIAMTDADAETLYLTAPDTADQTFGLHRYNSVTGDLYFDGETLILLDASDAFNEGAFWTAVWRQEELVYYGEYDCSLLRGNDAWYYNSVTANTYPVELLTP